MQILSFQLISKPLQTRTRLMYWSPPVTIAQNYDRLTCQSECINVIIEHSDIFLRIFFWIEIQLKYL